MEPTAAWFWATAHPMGGNGPFDFSLLNLAGSARWQRREQIGGPPFAIGAYLKSNGELEFRQLGLFQPLFDQVGDIQRAFDHSKLIDSSLCAGVGRRK